MKNEAVSRAREAQSVAQQDLLGVMKEKKRYTQDDIYALLPDRPKMAVRDTLSMLVNRGLIWRDASGSRVRYSLLEGERLRDAPSCKTIQGPSNWGATLTGYDAEQLRFRDLCMATRK